MTSYSIDDLRRTIEAFFDAHPQIRSETTSRGVHLRVFRTQSGLPIGHEHQQTTMQGIWVRRDSVRLDRLKHLDWRLKTELDQHRATTDGVVGRNSNLESVDGFAGDALIYFRVKDPAEFSTIMGELLG